MSILRIPQIGLSWPLRRRSEFEEVYEAHFEFVFRCVLRFGVVEQDAGDVTQEVFLIVHRKLSTFEGRSHVRTWLYAIARRVVSRHFQQTQKHESQPLEEHGKSISVAPTQAHSADARRAASLVNEFLELLPDAQAEVFQLIELEECSAPEVAEITGAPINTVYSRLRLAREALNRFVEAHNVP